jgi:hypothetical protein
LFLARSSLLPNSLLPLSGPISSIPVPSIPISTALAILPGHPSTHARHSHSPSSVRRRQPTNKLMASSWYVRFVCSPLFTAFVTTKPLASMSSFVCQATEASVDFPYLIAIPFSSSSATIFPLCHSVLLLFGLTHVTSISVPCPSMHLTSAGTDTRVVAPSCSASLTVVPASSTTSCQCSESSSYSIRNFGSSPSFHWVGPTVPLWFSPFIPPRVSFPLASNQNVVTRVPGLGNHRPLWFSCLGISHLFGTDLCIHIMSVFIVLITWVPTAALTILRAFFSRSLSLLTAAVPARLTNSSAAAASMGTTPCWYLC